ncbi:hypothetical protein ACWC4J_38115 [Streptomyces sp. NPDC001356]
MRRNAVPWAIPEEGEARIVVQQLKIAAAPADVPVEASCFCRLRTAAAGSAPPRGCCAEEH